MLATSTLLEYRKRGGHDPDALIALARALGEAGRNDEAIDVFEDVLMVAPLRAEVHREFGDRLAAPTARARRSSNIRPCSR